QPHLSSHTPPPTPRPPPFPYTTLFRSQPPHRPEHALDLAILALGRKTCRRPAGRHAHQSTSAAEQSLVEAASVRISESVGEHTRSEEHTSELQSPYDLVCRLLLEKKKK